MKKQSSITGKWWHIPTVHINDLVLSVLGFGHIGGPAGHNKTDMPWPKNAIDQLDLLKACSRAIQASLPTIEQQYIDKIRSELQPQALKVFDKMISGLNNQKEGKV